MVWIDLALFSSPVSCTVFIAPGLITTAKISPTTAAMNVVAMKHTTARFPSFFDNFWSKVAKETITLDTMTGKTRRYNIRRKSSPGNDMYIASSLDGGFVDLWTFSLAKIPIKNPRITPNRVRRRRRFTRTQ